MYARLTLASLLMVAISAALVMAEPSAAKKGRGQAGRGASGTHLLSQKSVQDDLKLTSEQVTKLKDLQKESREKMKSLSRDERRSKGRELAAANQEAVKSILDAGQQQRLKEISLQLRGPRAFSDKEVSGALKLSDDQKSKIKAIFEEVRASARAGGSEDREARRAAMEQARAKAFDVLTAEQKAAWDKLIGKKFEGKIERGPGRGDRANASTKTVK